MKKPFFNLLLLMLAASTAQAQLTNNPDTLQTNDGPLVIHPINHGTVALEWNGHSIYVDPYGGAGAFAGLYQPDLILITDIHGDHLDMETLEALNTSGAVFIVPQAVADQMPDSYSERMVVMNNGDRNALMDMIVSAIPMYNIPEEGSRHPKGRGNGYILNLNGTRVYLSGDTEDIPEMRRLTEIDVAFVCMNLPYTMDVNQAASAVLDFEPGIVYPYHHRGQDIQQFKKLVDDGGKDIEVRLKNWYPER